VARTPSTSVAWRLPSPVEKRSRRKRSGGFTRAAPSPRKLPLRPAYSHLKMTSGFTHAWNASEAVKSCSPTGRARDPVGEHDFTASDAFHACVNPDEFVVLHRDPVFDFDPGNREPQASALEFRVRHAALAHERRPPEFTPHQVVAVVRTTHLIGLGVPHAHFRRSDSVCVFHAPNMLPRRAGCRTFFRDGCAVTRRRV